MVRSDVGYDNAATVFAVDSFSIREINIVELLLHLFNDIVSMHVGIGFSSQSTGYIRNLLQ